MSSPEVEAERLEKGLLEASANTEYIGRRPSSSGRDTKRISQSPLPFSCGISGLTSLCATLTA